MSNMGINSDNTPILFKSFNADEIILDNNEIGEVGLIMLIKVFGGIKNLKKNKLKKYSIKQYWFKQFIKNVGKKQKISKNCIQKIILLMIFV